MRLRALLLVLLIAGLAAAGWPRSRDRWEGLTSQELGYLNHHRVLGLAYLENGDWRRAPVQFRAIQSIRPGLAFGFVNEALASMGISPTPARRLPPPFGPSEGDGRVIQAVRGASRLPRSADPLLVLAALYVRTDRQEEAVETLERALRLEPRNVRVLGALKKCLDVSIDKDGKPLKGWSRPRVRQRVFDLTRRLAEVVPKNRVAVAEWMHEQAIAGDYPGAARTLERWLSLLPECSGYAKGTAAQARAELLLCDAAASTSMARLRGTVAGEASSRGENWWSRAYGQIYGDVSNPAELAMREWDTPPPAQGPPIPDSPVTWKDVTAVSGLSGFTAEGDPPVAVGDFTMGRHVRYKAFAWESPLLSYPDLVMGGVRPALLANAGGGFYRRRTWGISGSPLLADLNNDFSLDLFMAGPRFGHIAPNPVMRRAPSSEGVSLGKYRSHNLTTVPARGAGTPLAVDLDQDGWLDLVLPGVSSSEPVVRLLRNERSMRFADRTRSSGLPFRGGGARQIVVGDWDGDQDLDLYVVRPRGRSMLLRREAAFRFRATGDRCGILPDPGARCAAVADADRDGDWDIAVAAHPPHGTLLYRNAGGRFSAESDVLTRSDQSRDEWIAFLDFDNDTWQDLVIAGNSGVRLLRNEGGRFLPSRTLMAEPASWVQPLDYDQDGDLDLLAVTTRGRLRLLRNEGGNRLPWIRIEIHSARFRTNLPPGHNAYGIGTPVVVRTAWDDQHILISEAQTHVGLGRCNQALAVRVQWPGSLHYNEIMSPTNKPRAYPQIQLW